MVLHRPIECTPLIVLGFVIREDCSMHGIEIWSGKEHIEELLGAFNSKRLQ